LSEVLATVETDDLCESEDGAEIARCSSVFSVVGERCGTAASWTAQVRSVGEEVKGI
jgi:hypothetical protein